MKKNKRLIWIDILKGFLILTVVFLHSFNGYDYGNGIGSILKYITSFHMITFFCLSGYFFNYENKMTAKIIKKKANALIKPFIIWGVIIGFLLENIRIMIRLKDFNLLSVLLRIVTLRESYLASWFLIVLFGVYIVEYCLSLLSIDKDTRFDIFLFIIHIEILIIGLFFTNMGIGEYFRISLICISSFFFYVGYLIKRINRYNIPIAFIALVIGITACFFNDRVTYSDLQFGNYFLFIISGISTSYGLISVFNRAFEDKKTNRLERLMNFLGNNSIIILLTHLVFLYLIRIIEKIFKMGIHTFPPLLSFIIITSLEIVMIKIMPEKIMKSFGKNRKDINMAEKKLNGTVIVTYRCNARCTMCNRYKCPSKPDEEISIETIKKLPKMYFTNITGGEPFIREDLQEVVEELYKKSDRIVISTNGFFTDRIIAMAKRFPNIGIRISIEGLEKTNNEIRGLKDGYKKGYTTLKKLKEMGMKDVGFGMTVQDKNAPDLVPLYNISNEMDMEFATASLHNSFYFVEAKNIIHDRPMVAQNFEDLVNELLNSKSPKKWFRAYFNHGLINYIYGQKRLLPCDMAFDTFFIDPYGDVMPCNGTKDKEVMGNLNEQTWDELWNSEQADKVREKVRHCDRQCWMIGSVSPAMHKYIWKPAWWVLRHKAKFWTKKKYSMYELPIVRDYRDGKVTKEELDKCSTCDLECEAKDGLPKGEK